MVSSLVWVKSPSAERKWPWRIWPSSARIVRQVSPLRVSASRTSTSARKQIEHVGADTVVFAVEDGPQQQRALEVAEGALGLLQLLVAERDVLGRQARVAGGEQVLAVEAFLGGDLGPVE